MTRIFISHSHSDEAIAYKLVTFLLAALRLEEEDILCTSNPDQGLNYSASSITDQLKNQLKNSEALIVLITTDSLHSAWIPFETGTFWTTDKPVIPILGPGLAQNDLPGPLKSFNSISIKVQDAGDKLNSATSQLAQRLDIRQKVTTRRNVTLKEFSDALRAWQSKQPAPNPSQQAEIEQLKAQIQESERSHQQQLEELKIASQQEKEKLEQNYQNQKQELEQSLQSQIRQLEQQLAQEKSHNQQLKEIEATSQLQKQQLERSYQTQIAEKELEINRLQKKIEQLQPQVLVELKSARDVNYTKLRDLLAAGKWKEADQETADIMLKVANRQKQGYLDVEDIDNFPCEDLRTIDQLWVHYSNGRFGFSVQKNIYIGLGGTREYNDEVWEKFGDQVGWRKGGEWLNYSDLTFELRNTTPRGHLPSVGGVQVCGVGVAGFWGGWGVWGGGWDCMGVGL